MDIISDCFFENFTQLERNSLHLYEKRQDLVEYFNTLIEACTRATESDVQDVCKQAIESIVNFHQKNLDESSGVCKMGNNHNILYVGAKLCYDWQLKDSPTVTSLLKQIYHCEGSFERLWVGALFGKKAVDFFIAWKCDFTNQEENVRAMVYFLHHSNRACLTFDFKNKPVRLIDLPMGTHEMGSPLQLAVNCRLPEKTHILLRFGAQLEQPERILEDLLTDLGTFGRRYSYNLTNCLCFLMRAFPGIYLDQHDGDALPGTNTQRDVLSAKFPHLLEDGIIPVTRSGIIPPELKHLSRCCIREQLWKNFQLPGGIHELPLPENLQKYLDLLAD